MTGTGDIPLRYPSRYGSPADAEEPGNAGAAPSTSTHRRCSVCQVGRVSARARYCSDACKQRAYRLRRTASGPADLLEQAGEPRLTNARGVEIGTLPAAVRQLRGVRDLLADKAAFFQRQQPGRASNRVLALLDVVVDGYAALAGGAPGGPRPGPADAAGGGVGAAPEEAPAAGGRDRTLEDADQPARYRLHLSPARAASFIEPRMVDVDFKRIMIFQLVGNIYP